MNDSENTLDYTRSSFTVCLTLSILLPYIHLVHEEKLL